MKTAPSFVTRRHFLQTGAAAAAAMAWPGVHISAAPVKHRVDVCIYGGTSGGVIAAVALAKLGRSVALVEPLRHLGGMSSGGLGWVDVKLGGMKAVGGLTSEYYSRIRSYYKAAGVDVGKLGNFGAVAEPHVAEKCFEEMLAEQAAHIVILRESRLHGVRKEGRRLRSIVLDKAPVDRRGAPAPKPLEGEYATIEAEMFLDCSYEGDLLAAAGVTCRLDREGRAEFDESAAGVHVGEPSAVDPYLRPGDPSSGLVPFVSGAAPGEEGAASPIIQAFNFRLCLVKKDSLPIEPPADYQAARYELLARSVAAQEAAGKATLPLKISILPFGKTDVNNSGPVSMDFIGGGADRYARGSWAERAELWHAHEDYQRGVLHFLRQDPRVPESIRTEVAKWGLPKDEFQDTGGWPFQLYIREARRMVGSYVVHQGDCEHPQAIADSIGLGAYALDSHICQRVVQGGRVAPEGTFMVRITKTFPIPYRAICPKESECENLLATFCVSSTHASFAAIRMEPPFMVMSESAAFALHQALEERNAVQRIASEKLIGRLRTAGQAIDIL